MGTGSREGGCIGQPPRRMTVRESDRATSEWEDGVARYERADDVYQSLVDRISEEPECGEPLAASGSLADYLVVKSKVLKEAMNPQVRILYKYVRGEGPNGKDTLEVMSVTFLPPSAGKATPTPPSHRI